MRLQVRERVIRYNIDILSIYTLVMVVLTFFCQHDVKVAVVPAAHKPSL